MKRKISYPQSQEVISILRQARQQNQPNQNRWNEWNDWCHDCTIRSGSKMVPFHPYPKQQEIIQLVEQYNNTLFVKTRQVGLTQIICSWLAYKAIGNPAWVSAVFCRGQAEVNGISRRVNHLLNSSGIELEIDNISLIKILGGGEIHFKNSSKEGLRSLDSVSATLYDEAAFVQHIADIYSASVAASAMVENAKQIVISTPSAKSGWYWERLSEGCPDIEERCNAVASGEIPGGLHHWVDDSTCKIIYHWRAHPIYSQKPDYLKWRKEQESCDEETLQREHNLKFVNAAVSVFSSELVRSCFEETLQKDPQPELGDYFAGLDCSAMGTDYTVFIIYQLGFDGVYRLAAIYRKRQESMPYHLNQIADLLEQFEPLNTTIETTGGSGQNYLDQLTVEFQHLTFQPFKTTQQSKLIGVNRLSLLMEKGQLKFPKKSPIVQELLSFQRKDSGRMEAAPGKHDDVVMSTLFTLSKL